MKLKEIRKTFFESGKLSQTEIWHDGILIEKTDFFENGNMISSEIYKNGKLLQHKDYSFYGILLREEHHIENTFLVEYKEYTTDFSKSGHLVIEGVTENDICLEEICYSSDGNRESSYAYSKDLKQGSKKKWDKNGQYFGTDYFQDGELQEIQECFFLDDKLIVIIYYNKHRQITKLNHYDDYNLLTTLKPEN